MALSACIALSPCLPLSPAAAAQEPFLTATGATGLLRDEEERLFKLRVEKEEEVRAELDRAREELEQEGRTTMVGKLCATPFGIDIVGITEFVALVGALVGGVTARQRKDELERLNEQLRKINMSLRQQARAGTIYAPGLTYVPAGPTGGAFTQQPPPPSGPDVDIANSVSVPAAPLPDLTAAPDFDYAAAASSVLAPEASVTMKQAAASFMSIDEEDTSTEARQCLKALKEGKRLLKEKQGATALVHFEKALMLAKFLGNKVQERRAVRGLAAAARLQGQHAAAVKHLERVLQISDEMQDHVGDADAYGTIADIYTDMGDFDNAGRFYDRYIEQMSNDGPV